MTFAQLSSQNRIKSIILQILGKNGSYIAMEEMLYIIETKTQQFVLWFYKTQLRNFSGK